MCAIQVGKRCSVIGCNKTAIAKGLCDMHRKRQARHGTIDDSVGKLIIEGYAKLESHPLYEVWRNFTRYKNGSEVCEEWKVFPNFVRDAGEKPSGNFRLCRINPEIKFGPGNVRWQEISAPNDDDSKKAYMREYMREARKNNPEYFFNKDLQKYYGITADDYYKMLSSQNGVCAICGREERRRDKFGNLTRLHVDHCHETHQVRGLLCRACNISLGNFEDNVTYLRNAISYLQRFTKS